MTETAEIQDVVMETMTGADVRRIRDAYKLGRSEFAVMCGYSETGVRIGNIEKKESWKPGDRERVYAGLMQLLSSPPRDKHGRVRGESGAERAARLDGMMHKRQHVPSCPVSVDPSADPALLCRCLSSESHVDSSLLGPTILSEDSDDGLLIPDVTTPAPLPVVLPTPPPITFDDDGTYKLTNSELGVWQRCRRKWWLGVFRMLALKQENFMGPRAVGNRVHRALAAWYVPDGQERTDPREALERVITEDWTRIAQQARAQHSYVDDETSLSTLAAEYNQAVSLERAMVEGYIEWKIEQGDDANLRVTSSESPINAILEGAVAGEAVRVRVMALLDVRATRVTDGVRMFVDHKTVGNFAEPRKTLHMDPQMLEYHLLEFLNSSEGEARCDGALYNMIRRVKRTAAAKPPFYERVEVHHNEYEIDAYRRRMLGAARDIQRAVRELNAGADPMSVVYPNPTHDCSWSCDFFAVCPMFDDGSRVEDAITALYKVQDPMARYDVGKEI